MSYWKWWQISAVEPSLRDGIAEAEAEAIAIVNAAMFSNQEGAQSSTALYTTSSFRPAASTRILTDFAS